MRLEYFQLIDRIVDLDLEHCSIRATAQVPTASTIFEGHFPGYPLMPGVLLLETMAQTSGWLIIGLNGFSRMPFLAAFAQAKLRNFVRPGETLEITATLLHDGSGFARTKAEIRKDGKPTCSAEIIFRAIEFPNPQLRGHLEEAAAAIGFPMQALRHD
jgi:3-hydroxyacyl-[acyl-carrier-protein] dehydratase